MNMKIKNMYPLTTLEKINNQNLTDVNKSHPVLKTLRLDRFPN